MGKIINIILAVFVVMLATSSSARAEQTVEQKQCQAALERINALIRRGCTDPIIFELQADAQEQVKKLESKTQSNTETTVTVDQTIAFGPKLKDASKRK